MSKRKGITVLHTGRLAATGTFVIVTGVTVSSILYGAQSTQYYGAVVIGFVLAIPFLMLRVKQCTSIVVSAGLVASAPPVLWALQTLFLDSSRFHAPSLLMSLALSAVILTITIVALLPAPEFRRTMMLIALAHLFICIYGLLRSDPLVLQAYRMRFDALDVHTAVWAEIGLGMLVAAVLSRARLLIYICSGIMGVIIFATQMRGAGLAALTLLSVYLLMQLQSKTHRLLVVGVLMLLAILIAFEVDRVISIVNQFLLLDDPHRGIEAGFSGRLENWRAGFERFLASPIIGVGVGDPDADYTHNGYIKVLAQFGVGFGLLSISYLALALQKAWTYRNPELVSVMSAYAIFLISTPRYINFQIMPLLGLVAIAAAIVGLPRACYGAKRVLRRQAPANPGNVMVLRSHSARTVNMRRR